MKPRLDHIVIAAESIAQGVDYVRETLGVDIPFGGKHPKMGTHNCLMQIDSEMFLEIISIDFGATAPETPRWFDLDSQALRKQIKDQPKLVSWVVNTTDINTLTSKASYHAGIPELITRGKLSWYFALTSDGTMPAGGMLPYIIQWETDSHPALNMADKKCKLIRFEIFHPYPEWLERHLASIDAENLVDIIPVPANTLPYLKAHFETPSGIKTI